MEQINFIEKLNELTSGEDLLSVSKEVSELRGKFEDYLLEEERKFQVSQLEAEEKGEPVPESESDFGKEEFYTIYNDYQAKRKSLVDEKKSIEANNLKEKKALIKRLEDVVRNEENIGAAFAAFKEVQEKWKEVGDIPRDKRSEVQADYSKLIEDFFYNINIYKELQEHDLHRNHQLKLDIIEQLKALSKLDKIKEVEQQLKVLQNDWEDIGPVSNEEWEKMKDAYWTEVRSVYNRINRYYDDRRAQLQLNLDQKKALLEEIKTLNSDFEGFDNVKAWNARTQEIISLQDKWKSIGFGPKKENEQIWKAFRSECDAFFEKKKEFFGEVHEQFDAIAEQKKKLIDKANELKVSTDWKDTAERIKKLQQQWKNIGHAGVKHEQKLWKSFRAACDHFFNSRQKHFEAQDKEFENNLVLKQAIIEELQKYEAAADAKTAIADIKAFSERFNAAGRVPMKQKDEIYKSFKAAVDKLYADLKLEGAEKEKIMFQAKVDTMTASPNSNRLLNDTKFEIRKQIDKHKREVAQLENNLGFFANSKGANELKQQVEKKIEAERKKIEALKMKIKMIPNE